MIEQNTSLIIDTKAGKTWCMFEHLVVFDATKPPEVILVGVCPLAEVTRMTDGRRNSIWVDIFRNGGQVMVNIIATSESKSDLVRRAVKRLNELRPRCNAHGFNMKNASNRIECSNGKTYDSQRDAAVALGLDASAISRHLRGHTSHVMGYTFSYAMRPRMDGSKAYNSPEHAYPGEES